MSRPRVIVVGGGLAGLAAAVRAADAGAEVELYERAPRLGGATWSFRHDGLSYDNGQHVFMRCCTEYRAFLERVGSGDEVALQARMDVPVLRPGGAEHRLRRVALPAPLHLVPALARYGHLSPGRRLRAVRTALALQRLRLDDPALDGVTFGTWLADHGGDPESAEALWDLVCLPTVNLRAGQASLTLAAKVFRTGLLDAADAGDIGWARVPLQELHGDAAARTLARLGASVHTGARVTAVEADGDGPWVRLAGERRHADAVIVAVPHDAAGALLPSGSFDRQAEVAALGRSPIVNVHLLYDRPVLHEPFVAGIGSPVQFVFDRTAAAGAPAGHQCLAISLSAADDYLPWSRQELVHHFAHELVRLLPPAGAATLVSSMVTREVAATFRGAPGTAALRPGPRTRLPGVYLAGAWTDTGWPATMEGAVRSGNRAAAEAATRLRADQPTTTGAAA